METLAVPRSGSDSVQDHERHTGMAFTVDWFSKNIPVWESLFARLRGRPNLQVLEIGSFEGRSACWLLEHVLTGEDASLDCVDTFEGSMEHEIDQIGTLGLLDRFYENIKPWKTRVTVHIGRSETVLPGLDKSFDVIYVDGSHTARDTLTDAVLAWRLLKVGGLMIFDDYEWVVFPQAELNPKLGIDAFLNAYIGWFIPVHVGYQVVVRKNEIYLSPHNK